jgi:hypothetical protein
MMKDISMEMSSMMRMDCLERVMKRARLNRMRI